MRKACTTCAGKGYVSHTSHVGGTYYDKCQTCRGSKIAPAPIGAEADLKARRLITEDEVRRLAGHK